ncbi:Fic family protein [Sphingopyxis sp. DBS4]|uniref:Fic family protein n=1 Tax=Sphingopyxis sp. DBS4 TaxID=2968500 RepID=UPI00214B3001|nr:Fic family protein [Sphingopyxis sp. DBS4]
MLWNWQLSDWTQFTFDEARLRDAETRFLKGAGVVVGSMHHLDGEARHGIVVELISQEMVDSSAIEGEILDRISVQSSIARQLGFAADKRRSNPAEAGAAELMADLYRRYAEPLTNRLLFDWHKMLMNGRRDLAGIGSYRTHADPMQIVSGALHAPRIHFEAPPSDRVSDEMARFIAWFNDSSPQGSKPLAAITRAAIAHLWFETIHPFEDGNGRLGRALAEKSLAQSLEAPTLTALAATINRHKKAYYTQLHRASQTNRIDAWMVWFADIVLEAQGRTIESIRFLIGKTRLLDRLRGRINARQEKALIRMMAEGPDGFVGGLSAHNYRTITEAASATATRDLAELVELGALERVGERRYTRYHLTIANRKKDVDSTDGYGTRSLQSG